MSRRSARCSSTPLACRQPGSPTWARGHAPDMCEPAAAESGSTEPEPTPLLHPAEGVPELSVTVGQIAAAAEFLGQRARAVCGGRRAGVGFPLLQPRVPDSDPAGRRRHRAHRPGQPWRGPLDRAAAGRRGARHRRMDPALRRPGPAVSGRGRYASARAVRHRAGRATGRIRPGEPGHHGRSGCWDSGWPRAMARPTGPSARCPRNGSITRPSTWNC